MGINTCKNLILALVKKMIVLYIDKFHNIKSKYTTRCTPIYLYILITWGLMWRYSHTTGLVPQGWMRLYWRHSTDWWHEWCLRWLLNVEERIQVLMASIRCILRHSDLNDVHKVYLIIGKKCVKNDSQVILNRSSGLDQHEHSNYINTSSFPAACLRQKRTQ